MIPKPGTSHVWVEMTTYIEFQLARPTSMKEHILRKQPRTAPLNFLLQPTYVAY